MNSPNKMLIAQWGESTAYSAKSHFKSADLKKWWIKVLVIINIVFATVSILELLSSIFNQILGIISLTASVLILVFESQEDKDVVRQHMTVGNQYLILHRELQALYYQESITDDEVDAVRLKLADLDQSVKPIINQTAKKIAKKAIEEKEEMTKWWSV